MSATAIEYIYKQVKEQGQIAIDLNLEYDIVFSTLYGNLPINNRVVGNILDIPVDLQLEYTLIPNTKGAYPVNTRLIGTIGDQEFHAQMPYKMVFSTIAGNIPINKGIKWSWAGEDYFLTMPYTLIPAAARGMMGIGGGIKTKKFKAPQFKGGKMIQPEEIPDSGEPVMSEAGRPLCKGIYGVIKDIDIDIRFTYTYYCNTSSGRNPINTRAKGFLTDLSQSKKQAM